MKKTIIAGIAGAAIAGGALGFAAPALGDPCLQLLQPEGVHLGPRHLWGAGSGGHFHKHPAEPR